MKPKTSLGIAMLGIFLPLIINTLIQLIINYIIIPTDFDLYLEYASIISFFTVVIEILRYICIGQSFFFRDMFHSVAGVAFGVIAILMYIAGNVIPPLLSFSVELNFTARGCIFFCMWLSLMIYMLFTKAWLPIKIAGVIAILPILASLIFSTVVNGYLNDFFYEYGETITTISIGFQWCILLLAFFPVVLTVIRMLSKTSDQTY